jgi:membrane-associated protease RseP (regulator of RpoE activity)
MGGDWLSIEFDGPAPYVLFLIGWYVLLKSWEARGRLDDWNASRVLIAILMLRTSRGKKALEFISRPRKFWRAYGEVSLWVCWIAMFLVALVLIGSLIITIIMPNPDPPPVSELLAIPGVNPAIPIGWGVIALVISLVIHEFGHGIQARAHGMRIRNFGLLMLGPLPIGAFAEPEHSEIANAPRRERQRMFAAGPSTNLFTAFILMLLLGGIAGQFVAAEPGVHSTGIVVGSGAEEAGLEPWDVILAIDNQSVGSSEDFTTVMDGLEAGQVVSMDIIRSETGEEETLTVTLTDKYAYYIELGYDEEVLANSGIEEGDAFLGVQNLADGTAAIDRLAGPAHPDFEASPLVHAFAWTGHTIILISTPFEFQGSAMHPVEEGMLAAGDGWLAELVGLEGLLFLTYLMFWLIWVNILLGFTNLIPMIPFDGGHLFRDLVHMVMSGLRNIGNKTKLWKMHPLWVDHVTRKASTLSSIGLLIMVLFIIISPYL